MEWFPKATDPTSVNCRHRASERQQLTLGWILDQEKTVCLFTKVRLLEQV